MQALGTGSAPPSSSPFPSSSPANVGTVSPDCVHCCKGPKKEDILHRGDASQARHAAPTRAALQERVSALPSLRPHVLVHSQFWLPKYLLWVRHVYWGSRDITVSKVSQQIQ